MSPTAVLAGLLLIVGFTMSHSVVKIEGTDWVEPVLLRISICMPTGMGKSSLCRFLRNQIKGAKTLCGLADNPSKWLCDDQSFEKMGDLMSQNHCKYSMMSFQCFFPKLMCFVLEEVYQILMSCQFFFNYTVQNTG